MCPIPCPAFSGLFFFYDQPPNVPVCFDHRVVYGPVRLCPGMVNNIPESVIELVRDCGAGYHEIRSFVSTVNELSSYNVGRAPGK